ncbi:MAG: TldD/PmbA family protein [Bdellovibrionales bacterium]
MLVNDSTLNKVIDQALAQGADFAEVYLEDTRRRQFSYLDARPEKAISGHTLGAGIRVFAGTEQIYTYTNDLSEAGLLRASTQAAAALKATHARKTEVRPPQSLEHFGTPRGSARAESQKQWASLKQMDGVARAYSGLISQVHAEMAETHKNVQIINSEGVHRTEARNYLNAMVRVYAEENGNKEYGYERTAFIGTPDDWEKVDFSLLAQNAAAQSVRILRADWTPAGEMPVLIDSGFGGVIFHEACGHGLETTSVAKNASVFCGKLNERVAHECVTAIDDGTIPGDYGSLAIDDEGESTRRTVLIENGILKSYIVDKMGARKTGLNITGSGRRQDYRFAPTSRMRNTFIAPGNATFEDMIRDIDYGLYAKSLGGGSVMPGTGSYNFAVNEAFIVRNGKIEKQVKGASLIGTGIETLGRIVKVGRELKLAPGTCGSISGMIPVTVGQPPILVSKLTVGGKA